MAGRPQRRLREAAMMNPLVGWEDLSGLTSQQVLEPYAPLVASGARARYAEVYTRVGLPLAVVLHAPEQARMDPEERKNLAERDMQLAKRLNAIVLTATLRARTNVRHYSEVGEQRGSPDRFSPMTPFVLLHRLGDELLTLNGLNNKVRENNPAAYYALRIRSRSSMGEVDDLLGDLNIAEIAWDDELRRQEQAGWSKTPGYRDEKDYLSRGVDTAAGKMGVISTDYLSDLWAKWLLTGKVAYSATNPPPESGQEVEFRNMLAEHAPKIFKHWQRYLMAKIPAVIPI